MLLTTQWYIFLHRRALIYKIAAIETDNLMNKHLNNVIIFIDKHHLDTMIN